MRPLSIYLSVIFAHRGEDFELRYLHRRFIFATETLATKCLPRISIESMDSLEDILFYIECIKIALYWNYCSDRDIMLRGLLRGHR